MLKEGEIICDECDGKGFSKNFACSKCFGAGKVDWVTNAMGRQHPFIFHHSSKTIKVEKNRNLSYTVLDLHRYLQSLPEDDTMLDMSSNTPTKRSTDEIITLQSNYTIDESAEKALYNGSIVENEQC